MEPTLTLAHIQERLPEDFQNLLKLSQKDGIRNMATLQAQWQSKQERFDRNGAALYGAFADAELIGIGGTTPELSYHATAMRMRRFFIAPDWRRKGIAGRIAKACMDRGFQSADVLTCNAQASAEAGPFWESLGFQPVDLPNITHVYTRR